MGDGPDEGVVGRIRRQRRDRQQGNAFGTGGDRGIAAEGVRIGRTGARDDLIRSPRRVSVRQPGQIEAGLSHAGVGDSPRQRHGGLRHRRTQRGIRCGRPIASEGADVKIVGGVGNQALGSREDDRPGLRVRGNDDVAGEGVRERRAAGYHDLKPRPDDVVVEVPGNGHRG